MMQIIPVVDLLGGKVVHAQHGNRDRYQAIKSLLTESSDPIAICDALMALYSFQVLYIADLDRILGNHGHLSCIAKISERYTNLTIWLDAGCKSAEDLVTLSAQGILPVIGTESLQSLSHYESMLETNCPFVLSLDFKDGAFLGPTRLMQQPHTWPKNIIAMSMSKVGSYAGIDLNLIKLIQASASSRNIYAAGGVRHLADIELAKQLGCAGTLTATALHQKNIESQHIVEFYKK